MRRPVRHRTKKRAAAAALDTPEGNPYEGQGLAPDGLPLRVPVYASNSRHQVGWLGYADTKIERLTP